MVRVRQGPESGKQGVEDEFVGCDDCFARVARSGSEAAKEVKSWVPRMWVAACWRVARSRGQGQLQT